MSSRPLLISGIVGGVLAGLALLGAALVLVAVDGPALNGTTMSTVVLGAAAGWGLDAAWLAYAVNRLTSPNGGGGGEDGEGGDGRGWPEPPPADPSPPSGDLDWWPEFERDFHAHLEARERAPVAD